MKKNFGNIILILLIIFLNQKSYAKPIPPGSGEGDVPANILILLDSSDKYEKLSFLEEHLMVILQVSSTILMEMFMSHSIQEKMEW